MGYVIEIDDLSKRIIYPPRGMVFEPVPGTATVEVVPQKEKLLWQQVELAFALPESKTQLISAGNNPSK